MPSLEEMKKRHPRGAIAVQGLELLVLATILSLILVLPIYIFNIDEQVIVGVFTFPPDIIPQPYNLIGILLIPIGMLLVIWANYTLLYIGKISLRNREPMQKPMNLIQTGPYSFTRNPIYLGNLIMLLGLVFVWSSIVILIGLILVYFVFQYFIKREEIILEEEFGEEYRDFKNRVRRWL
ncbi:MAG: methyltransferase family protein [Promethearchaeota archaeon]